MAPRLDAGQQAFLQELTVRVLSCGTFSCDGRIHSRYSQSRHVMTEDEAVACLDRANAEFGTGAAGSALRASLIESRVALFRQGRLTEHQGN